MTRANGQLILVPAIFMSVSGYNLSNATIQVTDPDVTNQQSSSSYSSGKYYINSSVVYSTCDYFAA